ncbi:DNA polymerase III delta prime subunit/very-short-patch-repair endonuclease [Filimonas zeae]|uniref:AAA domain-containing protein n=1 Tax=Filimonas zeae TaxID=1737353 RepID=A0A917ISP3_9BACT|nr:DUF3320 domain-containing protein [Filimonas zeae]MDR6339546.1 DNA polymerase III delta prime subunit/very-short-patch-repair endonuclease [Filimonas zeae]GGH63118.1 hypothetical protein GCM10011379_13650 [Filimonas zeae]
MTENIATLIRSRLESSRKELLDLGLRNPLLNYKTSKTKGLQIVQEKSPAIFDILVKQGKSMTFTARPGKAETDALPELPELTAEELLEAQYDTKLQTNEPESKLQAKLLNTYYFARTSIEEQGINILYLALGMLNWYEEDNAETVRKAPLVLIPVSLDRSTAQERFKLRYTANEIGANLSLQAKMLADFNITIPDIPEPEDFNITTYFEEIASHLTRKPAWTIDADDIQLGFFSFGKFMLYHDLDTERWPADTQPHEHALIQSLFYDGFKDAPPTATEDDNLDEETEADALFHVVDSDSSQTLAMLAVNEGRNMVIQGPPGTGKSQTITNIIANALGNGKKVLFVAEKMAALDVVKRRLDSIQLGEACLELHSHKANKKSLHEELKRTLDQGRPVVTQLEKEVSLLSGYRNELNSYCKAANNTIARSGLSPHKIMGYLLQINQQLAGFTLPAITIPDIATWDADTMHRATAAANRIQAKLKDTGTPARLLFWGSSLRVLHPHEETQFQATFQQATQLTQALQQEARLLAEHLGLPVPACSGDVTPLLTIAQLVLKCPDVQGVNVSSAGWLQQAAGIEEILNNGHTLADIRKTYKDLLHPEAWQLPVLEIRNNLITHGHKWYKFLIGSYKQSVKQLAIVSKTVLPKDVAGKLQYADAILQARRAEDVLKEADALAASLFGTQWQQTKSDWVALAAISSYLKEVHTQIANGNCPHAILQYLAVKKDNTELAGLTAETTRLHQQQREATRAVIQQLGFKESKQAGNNTFLSAPFEAQTKAILEWAARLKEIHHITGWNNLADAVTNEGFGTLIQACTHWDGAKDYLLVAVQKTWYEYLIQQIFTTSDALRRFERATHEEVIEKFQQLDQLHLSYNRARVNLKHWQGIPRGEAGGQMNTLKTEFNKRIRHMPIRRLMQEAGMAIQAIKPVFMMSPMSIANFLTPGVLEFDLVIFDEASQVRPVEALGAVMRGKQLVVVGDSRQLPPSSFFETMNTDVEDEENITSDVQSILGMCDGQGAQQRMLRWHYRSRHESLISLSNHAFYENKLVIFPSPGSKSRMGLVFHYLPETIYDRGKTRTNALEAEKVAAAVIHHALHHPGQSLGVVAFSTSQRQAIDQALELKRRKHPETEAFFKSHSHEPFFIKNLENVQGDERDVIFISIGYGKTEEGKVQMNFGPLNNDGGERRLNVLITRAKLRCEVFTNITAEDITSEKPGINALKSFLYFAQHGKLAIADKQQTASETPFENMVALELEKRGFIVRRKVGTTGFYLDLAIVDPEHPGRYLLGIQCDGETYATAQSARDRDRLRHQVLETIGWRTYQLWSTEWYRNQERELNRLLAAIDNAKNEGWLDDDTQQELPQETDTLIREDMAAETLLLPPYQTAVLSAEIGNQELHLHPIGKLSDWLEEIVKIESPVHFDEAARRLITAAGVAKVGGRIRESLQQAIQHAAQNGRIRIKEAFLWHHHMVTPVLRERSALPSASKKIQYIAPEEIALAIKMVVDNSIAITPDDTIPLVAKMLGFFRTTEEMRKEILKAVEFSILNGIVKQDGELLQVV